MDFPMTEFCHGNVPEHRLGLPNYWVNTSNLNLVIVDRISSYKGLGPALQFTLTYNSRSGEKGMFGSGWRFSYESSLQEDKNLILLNKGSGQRLRFRCNPPPGSGSTPVEAVNLSGTGDRLLDYSTHWLYIPKGVSLSYRYERTAGKSTVPLHSVSDFDGNTVTLAYTPDGAFRSITDAAGRITRFESHAGLCTELVLPDGKRATFRYDAGGRLSEVTDLQGIHVRYEYGAGGLLSLMEVGEDRKRTVFQYNGPVLAAITDAAGSLTRYEGKAGIVRVTDPLGNTTTYASREGKTVQITSPLGESEFFTYEQGRRVGHTRGESSGSRMTYDAAGNPARYTSPDGHLTTFTYDQYGNPASETNPLGHLFAFTYDSRQHLTGVRGPAGSGIRFRYDQYGQMVSMEDQNNNSTLFSYDRFGNTAEITDPEGGHTRFTYDPAGLTLLAVTDARGNTTRYEFDGNRRMTGILHPDGTAVRHLYGCCARLATIDENGRENRVIRDPLLSVIERRDGDGTIFRYQYDACGRLVRSVDPRGQVTAFSYDAAGRLIAATWPDGESVRLGYASGRTLGRITDENGRTISFVLDRNGARVQETDQTGATVSATLDPLGRISGIITGKGHQISCRYDAEGHLIEKHLDGRTVASYGYDPAGNPVLMNDSSGTTTYRYNRVRSITGISPAGSPGITCGYDEAGNLTSLRYPDGLQVLYQYDARNRPVRVSFGNHEVAIRYDNRGNILSESRSNGTETTFRYDAQNRVAEATHRKGVDAFATVSCVRDPAGNICEENKRQPFGEVRRLTPFTATYTPHNQVETWNGDRYQYDPDGNLTGIEGVRSFSAGYDAFSHLVDLRIDGEHLTFVYNGRGQRVERSADGRLRRYLYGPAGELLAETDETGTLISCYIYCRKRLLAMISGGRTYFYHADPCGHITSLTDEEGNVSAFYAYDPFGNVLEETGSPVRNQPFTYCGLYGVMREAGGLYFMKRRYYDAVTGRFIQKDPIGILGGINVYTYAGNNPVTYMDPEGLFAPVAAAGLILVGYGGLCVSMSRNRTYHTINTVLGAAGNTVSAIASQDPATKAAAVANQDYVLSQIGNLPDAVMDDFWEGQRALWGAILTSSPLSFETSYGEYGLSNVYSGVKAVYDTVTGNLADAGRNLAETIPGWLGQVANTANNWIDAYMGQEDNKCK
jgi:RHS repeat-associated protein